MDERQSHERGRAGEMAGGGGLRGISPEKILINGASKRVLSAFWGPSFDSFCQQNDRNSDHLNWKIYQKSNFFFFNYFIHFYFFFFFFFFFFFHTECTCTLWELKSLRLFCTGRHLHIYNEMTSTLSQNLKYTCIQIQNVLYIICQPTFSLINYLWRFIVLPYVPSCGTQNQSEDWIKK